MNIIVAIIVGGVVGWIASLIMKTNAQMGILANIVVGIVGAALGHWLAGALGLASTNVIASLIVSILGAVILIAILKGVGLFR
jgi:uncharacterized membrane protein YeaQ/YmgE (transglycosylase-associated protein family)